MRPVSAKATGLPDRRHFLSTVVGAGALNLPLPALGAEPGPVETLWPEYRRLEAELGSAEERVMDAEDRYEPPPRPRWHPAHAEGGYVTIETRPGRGYSALDNGAENIAYLRDVIAREHEPDNPNVGYSNAPRARRARETLAQIEAWQAEVRRRKDAAGLAEAEAAQAKAGAAYAAALNAIFAIEAATFRELAFQAAILDVNWLQTKAERVLERLVELAGISPMTA